ncbi:MAG: DUF6439 family protein [Cyanobium sp.]
MPKTQPPARPTRCWPEGSLDQAVALQRLLTIADRDWHALKSQRTRRAAEQLAAALVLLLSGDDPGAPQASPARLEAIELVDHGLRWLRAEVSDAGCPSHRPVSTQPPASG